MKAQSTAKPEQSRHHGSSDRGGHGQGQGQQVMAVPDSRPEMEQQQGLLSLMAGSPRLQRKCACGAPSAAGGSCAACEAKAAVAGSQVLQKKLAIGATDDPLEREADRVADQVMAGPPHVPVSGASLRIQRFTNQATVQADMVAPTSVKRVLSSPGRPLEPALQQDMEQRFGHDFSRVRVHTDAAAARSAREVNAHAYTVGRNIVFGEGKYAPSTREGKGILVHELTHVVQQRASAQSATDLQTLQVDMATDTTAEREAEAARTAVVAEKPVAPIRSSMNGVARLQRLPGSPAGGCGLCYGQTNLVGLATHALIQTQFLARYPFLLQDHPILTERIKKNGGPIYDEPDFVYLRENDTVEIGEIKAHNPAEIAKGKTQLDGYESILKILGMKVRRMLQPPPIEAIDFPTLAPPGCPQTQKLYVDAPNEGLYPYWCIPDFKELIAICDCRTGKRKPKDVKVPVPVPVPVPNAKPLPLPVPQGQGQPAPQPEPVPQGQGQPAPQPEQEPKEEPKEPDKVIPLFPGKPKPAPEPAPEEIPLAARVGLAAAASAALVIAGKYLLKQAPNAAARRALIHAQLAALVVVLVLFSERVEAKPGPGESPLESLFKAIDAKGTPVPEDLRKRIESDPELKKLVEEAVTSKDATKAQEELNRKMVEEINQHREEFTDDDLRALLTTTQVAGGKTPSAAPTAEAIRKAIRNPQANDGGAGEGSSKTVPEKKPESPDAMKDEKQTLSPEVTKSLADMAASQKELWDAMTKKGKGPATVTDAVARRFLQIVPANLTPDQLQKLRARITAAQGETADEIVATLENAIAELNADSKPANAIPPAATGDKSGGTAEKSEDTPQGEKPQEAAARLLEVLKSYKGWNKIAAGRFYIQPAQASSLTAAIGSDVVFFFYEKSALASGGTVRSVAQAHATIKSRTGTKKGSSVVLQITGSTTVVTLTDGGTTGQAPGLSGTMTATLE